MVRSWFSQTSTLLQEIYEKIEVYKQNPHDKKMKKYELYSLVRSRWFLEMVFRQSDQWMSEEAFTSGISSTVLILMKDQKTKEKIKLLSVLILFLYSNSMSLSSMHLSCLLRYSLLIVQ